jgi:DNA-binding transcriptional LysR family regulator
VLNPGHRLAKKLEIVPEDLAGERMILMGEKSTITLQIERFLGGHDVRVSAVHRCAQVDTIKAFVAAGEGLAILPALVRNVQEKRRLIYRKLSGVNPVRTVSLVQNRQRYLTRATRTIAAMWRELTKPVARPAD